MTGFQDKLSVVTWCKPWCRQARKQAHTRVAIRASGNFNIQTSDGLVQGISYRHCKVVQRADGYGYSLVAKMDVTGTPPQHRNATHSALYLTGINADVSRAF